MPKSTEVLYVKKTNRTNPHERIQGIGGIKPDGTNWYLTIDRAIEGIESGKWQFWTFGGGKSVDVVVATHKGHKYLKTEVDGIYPNNLLALPDLP